ncbi:uncharacterized protein LOC109859867 isoform X2 [Pseudomyrmex gracilis]|nr:uncharacterized protein LOC109859867 isoform X2 [Pseudomyrmex gracilis]
MGLTVTEDTPVDMLAGSMEILVQMPRDHHLHTQRVTVSRSTPMMDLLVQIATAHKLPASSYTLQAIGERGLILPHHPNTPIGALDVLQVKLLPKQGTCVPRKTKQSNQPFETTFRLQVHMPRNQLYVSRVSPKMNLGKILDEVCREKNLDRNKYELRHPANLEETLDLSLSLQDYHLQEVTLYAKQTGNLRPTLSTQDIMALQRQEERHRQQTKQSVFGFMFKKSKESSLSTDSLAGRSASPARSDETARSASPLQPPARPQRKKRPAPKPPIDAVPSAQDASSGKDSGKDKTVINHSRNSSDSSGYHEASVLSDNLADSAARLPETLPRRSKAPAMSDATRKLAQTSQSSKSLGNLTATGATLSRGISNTSLSSTGLRKKRAAPPPPAPRPLSSAISTQALERIVDSEESLTSDMDPSKPSSDIGAPSKANSDIDCPKANSDIGVSTQAICQLDCKPKPRAATRESDGNVVGQNNVATKTNTEARCSRSDSVTSDLPKTDAEAIPPVEAAPRVEHARVAAKKVGELAPLPLPRKVNVDKVNASEPPKAPKRKVAPSLIPPRILNTESDKTNDLSCNNNDKISEHRGASIIAANAVSMNEDLVARIKENKKNNRTSFGEDQTTMSQEKEETSNIVENNNTTREARLRSIDQIGEVESDLELLQNYNATSRDSTRADAEEIDFKSRDEISNKFTREKEISDAVDDRKKNHEATNSNCERDIGSCSNSAELNASSTEVLNVTPEINFQNIDSLDECENHSDDALIPSSINDSCKESVTNAERATELKKNEEQSSPVEHRRACQRPPRAPRRTATGRKKIEENVETIKCIRPRDATIKTDHETNREPCTVISTIPKCDYLDAAKEDDVSNNIAKQRDIVENVELRAKKHQTDRDEDSSRDAKINHVKRTKVARSQSKSDDFETDSSTRQKRYLTSPSEKIAHALNLRVPARDPISSNATEKEREQVAGRQYNSANCKTACSTTARDEDVDRKEAGSGVITATDSIQNIPSETEILLQKVSDTLSNVLPVRPAAPETSSPVETSSYKSASVQTSDAVIPERSAIKTEPVGVKDESSDTYRSCIEFSMENATLNASTPNMTATDSQQDTSDYVSAMGEDLSISDWEYQLPAPPSAFRDSHSPVIFDDYDTQKSVKAFGEEKPVASPASKPVDATDSSDKNVKSTTKVTRAALSEKINSTNEAEIEQSANKQSVVGKQTCCAVSHKSTVKSDLRKDVISELENKIEHGALAQTVVAKDFDRRCNFAAPKIAPVDNTLSNFTITTYTKEKSLDIFEEESNARNSDERFLKTFATLSRSNDSRDKENATRTTAYLTNGISFDKKTAIKSDEELFNNCKTEPKTRHQNAEHRWQLYNASNEKTNIQRSKSYISMSNNSRYQAEVQEIERKPRIEIDDMKKATSITDLNVDASRNSRDEKFSQYRNDILRQEEPTKEKQLQSLQVLKSILPQLKNAQQSEENTSKEYGNALSNEKTRYESNEHSNRSSVSSTYESRDGESEYKELPRKENAKRYTYTGPPAISLGSWSERPSVNVQIKMDTDYKLGSNNARTVVNITDSKNRDDVTNYVSGNKSSTNKKLDEPVKNLVAHTTSNFQIPLSNRVDASKIEDRPVVMGVELKKTSIETNYPRETSRTSENEIDATLNFQELKKTFGQQVNLRQKPKRVNINRQSADYHHDVQSDGMEKIADSKQNGYAKFARSYEQNDVSFKSQSLPHGIQQNSRTKKFISVKDINGTSQNIGFHNETSFRYNVNNGVKINPPMPVVKGFKIPTVDSKTNNNQVNYNHNRTSTIDSASRNVQIPKPVTAPVITGVTLKSVNARPNSMPVQLDSRDMLLESIRNFGGREKLKSTAERY